MIDKQMGSRPWSDLPVDILNLIIGRLSKIIDQICFLFVCKNWRLAEVHYERNPPWLLALNWHYDSSNGGAMALISYLIPFRKHLIHIKRKIQSEEHEFFGARVCASKHGWLLLQQSCKVYLYNPFSRKAIKLPNMEIGFNRATFSSNPTSPDCICFAILSSRSSDKIRISICSPGDLEWCIINVDSFYKEVEDVVYVDGSFYCVFSGGILGVYNVSNGHWNVLTNMKRFTGIQPWYRLNLVESNEELLLVRPSLILPVFRFDWFEMVWKEIHELGNRALFLGCTSFAIAAEDDKTSALADKIYFHVDCVDSYFYCLRTKISYAFKDAWERIRIEPPKI